jgi:hypothetical protein
MGRPADENVRWQLQPVAGLCGLLETLLVAVDKFRTATSWETLVAACRVHVRVAVCPGSRRISRFCGLCTMAVMGAKPFSAAFVAILATLVGLLTVVWYAWVFCVWYCWYPSGYEGEWLSKRVKTWRCGGFRLCRFVVGFPALDARFGSAQRPVRWVSMVPMLCVHAAPCNCSLDVANRQEVNRGGWLCDDVVVGLVLATATLHAICHAIHASSLTLRPFTALAGTSTMVVGVFWLQDLLILCGQLLRNLAPEGQIVTSRTTMVSHVNHRCFAERHGHPAPNAQVWT